MFIVNADWGIIVGYVAQLSVSPCVSWCSGSLRSGPGGSVVPTAFWVFSIGGGIMLLAYALYRKDPVFIIGQAFGVFVYLRNLQFVLRAAAKARRRKRTVGPPLLRRIHAATK